MTVSKVKKTTIHTLLLTAISVIGIVLGLWQVKPPQVNETSPLYPAYQRMMENIQRLAAEPHPSGSAEIEIVRAQILAKIKDMGLVPAVEDEVYTASELNDAMTWWWIGDVPKDDWWEQNKGWIEEYHGLHSVDDWLASMARPGEDGTRLVQNILVKLDAPDTDHGVMFVSHYDSTSSGPGAADDMVAVSAMLEAMRAHSQNNAMKNDIYFIFTDGEEDGLLGANKFVKAHPELKDKIDMVINLDDRGNRGGLLLFETSPKAYSLLKTVLQSGARPIGMSLGAAIYAMMPNETDFTHFLDAGYNGINFAAAEGVEHYHQPTDTYENLHRATAWQYLHTTIALADYAAHNDLGELQKPPSEAVYFPFLPGVLVLMNGVVSHILCALACVLALVFGVMQVKTKRLKVSFSIILMGLLILLSIGSAILFVSGSYLFYIPLLVMVITAFLKKWTIIHWAVRTLAGVIVLLLWVPIVFLLWVSIIQPMML